MIARAVKSGTTVMLATVAILIFGMVSYLTLPRESNPDITIPVVMISTPYIGVAPEDVETLVTVPIESELASLRNVKDLTSTSGEGISFIAIEFEPDTVIEDALQKVRDRVNRARPKLPEDAEDSTVREISFNDIPILLVTVAGPVDESQLKTLAERLEDKVVRIPGVLDAKLSGGRGREVRVQVDPDRLAFYGLALHDVTNAIAAENVNIPGGEVASGGSTVLVRVPGELDEARPIEEIAVKRVGDRPVLVRDLARVIDGFEDRETFSRMNGRSSVTIAVTKRAGANILEVATAVKDEVARQSERWPDGVDYRVLGDQSKNVEIQVGDLQNNIITALLLVVAVVVFFMGLRNSFFVAFAIPMSMLMSMMVLDSAGFTLNMVVLFSLILALGMLVDNAIVVVENIYRHLEEGYSDWDAAILGTREVAVAVAASTATTVAAFIPLAFWGGVMGEFMGYLPKTLIVVLVSSLIVAVFVLPVLTSRLMKAPPKSVGPIDAEPGRIMGAYKWVLEASIRWRYASAAVMVVLLVFTFGVYGLLNHGTEFFPEVDPERAIIGVRASEGTDLHTTDRVVRAVEQVLATEANVDVWVVETGVSASGDALVGSQAAPNEARITVDFLPSETTALPGEKPRIESTFLTIDRLRERVAPITGAAISVDKEEWGPPVGSPVAIEIVADDFHTAGKSALSVRRALAEIPGVTDISDDYRMGRPEMRLRIDRALAKRVGVDTRTVGNTVRTAVSGTKASSIRDGEDEIDITVELLPERRDDLQSVLDLRLPGREDTSPDTFSVPLSSVAKWELAGGSGAIKHIDQEPVVTITADIAEGYNENAVRAEVSEFIDAYDLPAGVNMSLTGAEDEQAESMAFLLKAFAIAVCLIGLILVTQFDSFGIPVIILGTVVLSLIGVLWGLLITGRPFGVIMTGIGVISLAGVVVNNAIVLLDYVQQLQERGASVHESLVKAGMTRFRPVMLTALTTTLGLVPMAAGVSIDFTGLRIVFGSSNAQFWGSMAVAVIFGLTFATLLTLVMVPTFYGIYDDIAGGLARIWNRLRGRPTRAEVKPETLAPAAVALLVAGLMSGPAHAVTLQDAWTAAEDGNVDLALLGTQTAQAETLPMQAWSTLQPRVSTGATYVINQQEVAFDFADNIPPDVVDLIGGFDSEPTIVQAKRFWMADVTVSQRLFNGQSLPLLKGAYALREAARLREGAQRQRVRAGVAASFYGLDTARAGVEVARSALKTAEGQLDLAQRQKGAGLAPERAVLQARLGLAQAKRDLQAAQERLVGAEEAWVRMTGLSRDAELEVADALKVPTSLEDALAGMTRADIDAAESDAVAAKASATAKSMEWLPTIDGQFGYNYSENRGFGGDPWQWQLSIAARWTLWGGGLRIAQRRELGAQKRASELVVRQTKQVAQEEVRTSWEALQRARSALASVQSDVALAEENLELARRAYEAQDATWLEVEQAELGLRGAELAQLQERMNRDLAAIELLAALGALR